MRFEDWDILLFPVDCRAPVKEFKVACHVTHDAEFSNSHGSFGLPTVCCFIPSLAAGTPFQISIHSWSIPSISQFTRCYSKYGDSAIFEARVFIDGQLVASASLDREVNGPHIIIHSFGISKTGDNELLRFPNFCQELLRQNHWNPADDFGRIKIVISEGFPRDSLSVPVERIKNVVAFSFQHAPLEILEASCIAWPNPSMWRRIPVAASMTVQAYPSDDTESHAHSPRRKHIRINANIPTSSNENLRSIRANRPVRRGHRKSSYQSGSSRSTSGSTSTGTLETINDSDTYFEWLNGMGLGVTDMYRFGEQKSFATMSQIGGKSANLDMQTYRPLGHSIGPYVEQRFGLKGFSEDDERDYFGYFEVPTEASNMEASYSQDNQGQFLPRLPQDDLLSANIANSLTHSLLNQPMPAHVLAGNLHATPVPELRLLKEDCFHQAAGPSPSTASSASTSMKDSSGVENSAQQLYTTRTLGLTAGSYGANISKSSRSDVKQKISSVLAALENGSGGDSVVGNAIARPIEKGTKRNHDSASAPADIVKSDDNPKRLSPRARLTALLAHSPTVNGDR